MAIPSLAMIPSGYKYGKVYSVLPSNGDGDFTFSRGSNGTRVNKDGLIETMPLELGDELVTNGSFDTDSDWTKGTGWTISGGSANSNGTTSNLDQDTLTIGKSYKAEFTVSGLTAGALSFRFGGNEVINVNSNGTYIAYGIADTVVLRLRSQSGFIGSVDNVSVKEVISFDLPRLDYTDGSCPSLLLEPQSTNLIGYSEDFSDSSWSKLGLGTGVAPILTSNYAISPDGTQNATRVQFDKGSGTSQGDLSVLNESVAVSSGATTSKSVYIKSNTSEEYDIVIYEASDASGTNVKKVRVTSEWQRFDISGTVPSTTSGIAIGLREISVSGISNTADILVWGAQVEEQSYATSYIPTNGSIATRLADVCTDAGNASTFNSSEGVLFAEISALDEDNTSKTISISDGSNNNNCKIYYFNDEIYFDYKVSGSATISLSHSGDLKELNKVVAKYKSNDFSLWVNGFEVDTEDNGSVNPINTFNRLNFDTGNSTQDFYGKTKQLQYFDSALTDIELEELTSWSSFLEMAEGQQYKIK